MSVKPPTYSTPEDWSGRERRTSSRTVDAEVLNRWATTVDARFIEVQSELVEQRKVAEGLGRMLNTQNATTEGLGKVLTAQNAVLENISSALFAEDDKGQHHQIGLMTTAKRLCSFVLVVKWIVGVLVGGAALVAGLASVMGAFGG
jgi:hypothetical protein